MLATRADADACTAGAPLTRQISPACRPPRILLYINSHRDSDCEDFGFGLLQASARAARCLCILTVDSIRELGYIMYVMNRFYTLEWNDAAIYRNRT